MGNSKTDRTLTFLPKHQLLQMRTAPSLCRVPNSEGQAVGRPGSYWTGIYIGMALSLQARAEEFFNTSENRFYRWQNVRQRFGMTSPFVRIGSR